MKRRFLVLILVLLCGGVAGAEVQVFFLPESGFLRVSGEVIMEPGTSSLSLLVFPTAQITEFWADELLEYQVQRAPHGTVVTFNVQAVRPQTLSFSYEGFLEPQTALMTMDRDCLWFPEFSFAIQSPLITVQLPLDWEFKADQVADQVFESAEQGSYRVVKWRGAHETYPAFTVSNTTPTLAEDTPTDESRFSQGIPVVEEFSARIQMQVTRMINAIDQRNPADLATLLSSQLQEQGLAQYLGSLPRYYGRVTGEFLTEPRHEQDEFKVILSTERGFRYEASMAWQENAGRMELQVFRLTPDELPIPRELLSSMEDFVQELRWAVYTKNRTKLTSFVDTNIAQGQSQVVEFLANLGTDQPWSVEYAALEPFSLTILVPHSPNISLLLNVGLTPGEYHWLISRLEVIPLG